MTQAELPNRHVVIFGIIWLGQLVSVIGSRLSGFALGVWVYQQTGSVTQFALLNLFFMIPRVILSPFAGVFADRWNRRYLMMISDAGAGLGTLILAVLFATGNLQVWVVYVIVFLNTVFNTFLYPAYSASISLMVPKKHYSRASAMVQFGDASAQIIGPLLAGTLIVLIGLQGILLIDLVSFSVSAILLAFVRIPEPERKPDAQAKRPSIIQDATQGWSYIAQRQGLVALIGFFAVLNLSLGFVQSLLNPLVLRFSTPELLGFVAAMGSAGLLAGTLLLSVWGGPKRRIHSILGVGLLFGVCIMLLGVYPSIMLIAVANFGLFLAAAIINTANSVIWRNRTPTELQGRVFATLRMVAWSTLPIAFLTAGPLADQVVEPLLAEGGALASSIGTFIGVGPGRGIGFLFVLMGLLPILICIAGYSYRPLRDIEEDSTDVVLQQAPVGANNG